MFLEKCTAARGKCKATDEPFKKGDVRLAVCSKAHKAYYSMAGMGDAVRPIVEASEGEYTASDITGFLALSKDERAAVCAAASPASAKSSAATTIAEAGVVKDEKAAAALRVCEQKVRQEVLRRVRSPARHPPRTRGEEAETHVSPTASRETHRAVRRMAALNLAHSRPKSRPRRLSPRTDPPSVASDPSARRSPRRMPGPRADPYAARRSPPTQRSRVESTTSAGTGR